MGLQREIDAWQEEALRLGFVNAHLIETLEGAAEVLGLAAQLLGFMGRPNKQFLESATMILDIIKAAKERTEI
jgi:hypothetical protein